MCSSFFWCHFAAAQFGQGQHRPPSCSQKCLSISFYSLKQDTCWWGLWQSSRIMQSMHPERFWHESSVDLYDMTTLRHWAKAAQGASWHWSGAKQEKTQNTHRDNLRYEWQWIPSRTEHLAQEAAFAPCPRPALLLRRLRFKLSCRITETTASRGRAGWNRSPGPDVATPSKLKV